MQSDLNCYDRNQINWGNEIAFENRISKTDFIIFHSSYSDSIFNVKCRIMLGGPDGI